ncbi:MAG: MBL fold metallo-hydrolase [Firmicutes bacterium]|nr:MBL fold metallo-hydrolase [Bacillota bacterium]
MKFFTFTVYRAVLCGGLLAILILVAIFGEAIRVHYFPESNVFRHRNGEMSVHTIDVGHGDAIAIRFPDNRVALIDGGDTFYYSRVSNYLRRRVVGRNNRIDWMIATHPHMDHIGTLPRILQSFNVDTVIRPVIQSDSPYDLLNTTQVYLGPETINPIYTQFINNAYRYANNVVIARAGLYFGCMTTYGFRVFFHTPTTEGIWSALRHHNTNEISPIITVEFGNQIFVLTGDAGFMVENDFLLAQSARDMFIHNIENRVVHLHVGHHGSNGSSSNDFLRFLSPTTATISVGTRFPTLPNSTVVNRIRSNLSNRNDLFITNQVGHIAFRTCGNEYQIFFGFRNPPNLWWLFSVLVVITLFLCFFNFKRKQNNKETIH